MTKKKHQIGERRRILEKKRINSVWLSITTATGEKSDLFYSSSDFEIFIGSFFFVLLEEPVFNWFVSI